MEEESFHRPGGRSNSPAVCPTLFSRPSSTRGMFVTHPIPNSSKTREVESSCHPSGEADRGVLVRESIPRQVDEKSGVPEEERGVWGSQGEEKDKFFFSSTFLGLSHIKHFFSLSLELMITQVSLNSVLGIM